MYLLGACRPIKKEHELSCLKYGLLKDHPLTNKTLAGLNLAPGSPSDLVLPAGLEILLCQSWERCQSLLRPKTTTGETGH